MRPIRSRPELWLLCVLGLWLAAVPASAFTVERTADGFLARLGDGDSVRDAWTAIVEQRQATGAPATGRDVIELGTGTFPLTDAIGNPMHHRWYGHSVPPLTIRGVAPAASRLLCPSWHHIGDCLESKSGLELEDVSILSDSNVASELISVTGADLAMRRVHLRDQVLIGSTAGGAITA